MHVFKAIHEEGKKLPAALSPPQRLQAAVGKLEPGMRFELEEYGELVRRSSFGSVMDVMQGVGGMFGFARK